MSQSLGRNESPGRVYRTSRRHLRLTRRTGSTTAIEIADRIVAPRESLGAAMTAHATAQETTQDAFDDWEQSDRSLDRTVKSVDRKSVDWDEDHPGANTRGTLFGGMTTGQVVNTTREDEPNVVARIVARGTDLPEGHPVKPLLSTMTEQANASRAAHRAWVDAAQLEAVAATAVEVAKLQVVRIYYDNQIDLERACGRDVAEACFPSLRRTGRAAEPEDVEPTTPTA